jgi:pimeloyl-ACP methyl ester carboxylesterase
MSDRSGPQKAGPLRIVYAAAKWGSLAVLALAVTGAMYQMIASGSDLRNHPAPGRLVGVGGFAMHIDCAGEGAPTVILEAGNGGISSGWAWVQHEVAQHTRVCSYDRAGLGWSEASSTGRDGVTIARELNALLSAAGEEGPYIHVGHSLGGIYGRIYAAEYPDDIVGLVLVDASHPEQFERLPEELARQMAFYGWLMKLAPAAERLGIVRLTNFFGRMADGLPADDYARTTAMLARTGYVRVAKAEVAAWNANTDRLASVETLGDLPLAVITAGSAPGLPDSFFPVHQENQRELAGLSTRSRHEIVSEADHLSLLTRQDDAALAAAVIVDLTAFVRKESRPAEESS